MPRDLRPRGSITPAATSFASLCERIGPSSCTVKSRVVKLGPDQNKNISLEGQWRALVEGLVLTVWGHLQFDGRSVIYISQI
jgi:hypothetical protein